MIEMSSTAVHALHMFDPHGMWSLTLIPVIIIISLIMASTRSIIATSTTCLIITIGFACLFMDFDDSYIANTNLTKWKKRNTCNISEKGCLYTITEAAESKDDIVHFIPADELFLKDGSWVMKSTGKSAMDGPYTGPGSIYKNIDENYYNYETYFSNPNIPVWLYHPAAVFYPFCIMGLIVPGLMFVAAQAFKG